MARPMGPNDFLDSLNLSSIFSSQEKINLGKIFRRTVGKTLLSNVSATTTTYATVPDITFNVKKGAKYRIDGKLLTLGNTTGGVKAQLVVSGQTSPTVTITGTASLASTIVTQQATSGGVIMNSAGVSPILAVDVTGFYIPDADGVMTLQFAQTAASGTSTLYAGSHLKLIRVG